MKIVLCLLALVSVAMCRTIEIDERWLLDSLNLDGVVSALQTTLGSDVTEAACETACPGIVGLIPGGSLVAGFLCSPACHKLQSLG